MIDINLMLEQLIFNFPVTINIRKHWITSMIFHFPPHVILTLAGISLAKRMTGQLVKSLNPTESISDLSLKSLKSQQPLNLTPKKTRFFFGAQRSHMVTSLFRSFKTRTNHQRKSVGNPMASPSVNFSQPGLRTSVFPCLKSWRPFSKRIHRRFVGFIPVRNGHL